MHSLSPAVNPLVEQVLATGKYTDPNALLLDALQAFIDRTDSVEAIRAAKEDVAAGRTRPWREAVADVRARYDLPRSFIGST